MGKIRNLGAQKYRISPDCMNYDFKSPNSQFSTIFAENRTQMSFFVKPPILVKEFIQS